MMSVLLLDLIETAGHVRAHYSPDQLRTAAHDCPTGNVFGAFGDMSGFYIRFAGGIQIDRSEHVGFANDLVTYRFLARVDSDTVDTTLPTYLFEVDHKVPLADGGTDYEGNVWAICYRCHQNKTAAEARARRRA